MRNSKRKITSGTSEDVEARIAEEDICLNVIPNVKRLFCRVHNMCCNIRLYGLIC